MSSATRRLAVAPSPVAGERQEQRGDAERLERRRVEDKAREEAAGGAEDRAAQERDRDERDEQDVRHAAEDRHGVEHGHLQDRDGEQEARSLGRVGCDHGVACIRFGTSTMTESSDEKSTYGVTWTCAKRLLLEKLALDT